MGGGQDPGPNFFFWEIFLNLIFFFEARALPPPLPIQNFDHRVRQLLRRLLHRWSLAHSQQRLPRHAHGPGLTHTRRQYHQRQFHQRQFHQRRGPPSFQWFAIPAPAGARRPRTAPTRSARRRAKRPRRSRPGRERPVSCPGGAARG